MYSAINSRITTSVAWVIPPKKGGFINRTLGEGARFASMGVGVIGLAVSMNFFVNELKENGHLDLFEESPVCKNFFSSFERFKAAYEAAMQKRDQLVAIRFQILKII